MINFKLQSIPQQLFRIHNHVHYIYEVRQSAIAERSWPGGPRGFYFHKIIQKSVMCVLRCFLSACHNSLWLVHAILGRQMLGKQGQVNSELSTQTFTKR